MNRSLVVAVMFMMLIVPFSYAMDCISSSNCVNNSDINDSIMCEFTIDVPVGMDQVYIDVDQGSRFYSGRHFDMIVSNDDTNFSLFVNREILPVYLICSEASSSYSREQYIEMFTLGVDDNYSAVPFDDGYEIIERDDTAILVFSGLLLAIGLYGMIGIIASMFWRKKDE